MKPYDPGCDPGELGGVGERLCPSDGAKPLTAATSERVRKSRCLSQRRGAAIHFYETTYVYSFASSCEPTAP
jgi:hypothetical protein